MARPRNIAKHPFRDYSIAGMMVAVNDGTALQYLLTDHLGSTVAVTNSSGTLTSQQRYLPFGAPRAIPNSPILGTDFTYTGQRKLDDGMGGIMDYRARFYSPSLMRFLQPDSIIPNPANPQAFNRFSYGLNNPSRYTDPTGHAPCWGERLDDGPQCFRDIDAPGGLRFNNRSDLVWANEKWQRECLKGKHQCDEIVEGAELVTSILVEPADWAFTINHCAQEDCSPWMLAGLLPFVPSSAGRHIGKYGDELIALVGRRGFATFEQLKAFLGPAGDNMAWHHIVEQSQIARSGFSPRTIHNTGNVIAVDANVHRKISGFYSSIRPFTEGITVRNWLAGQSFGTQYEFGLQVLRDFGVIP